MGGVSTAWLDGWQRVRRAPAILLGVFALTFAAAIPFAVVMRNALASHLGASLEAATAAEGANWNWWQEFISQASGLGATFTPRIVGFAATLDSISGILDARRGNHRPAGPAGGLSGAVDLAATEASSTATPGSAPRGHMASPPPAASSSSGFSVWG